MDASLEQRYDDIIQKAVKVMRDQTAVIQELVELSVQFRQSLREATGSSQPATPEPQADSIATAQISGMLPNNTGVESSDADPKTETRASGDGRICIRCLTLWKGQIVDGLPITPCDFSEGRRRKKCLYCSTQRAECILIPASKPTEKLIKLKSRMEASSGMVDMIHARQMFDDAYWDVWKFIGSHPIEQDVKKRERQRKQRAELRAAQKARQKNNSG